MSQALSDKEQKLVSLLRARVDLTEEDFWRDLVGHWFTMNRPLLTSEEQAQYADELAIQPKNKKKPAVKLGTGRHVLYVSDTLFNEDLTG